MKVRVYECVDRGYGSVKGCGGESIGGKSRRALLDATYATPMRPMICEEEHTSKSALSLWDAAR